MKECIKTLRQYYSQVQPQSAGELLGIENPNSILNSFPAIYGEVPWKEASGPDVLVRRRAQSARELGCDVANVGSADSSNLFGPLSKDRIEFEAARLVALTDSIRANGFRDGFASSDFVTGWILTREDKRWVVDISGGKHRISALAALGYSEIPVVLSAKRVVCRVASRHWPAVKLSQVSQLEAEQIFDRVFSGRSSAAWLARSAADAKVLRAPDRPFD